MEKFDKYACTFSPFTPPVKAHPSTYVDLPVQRSGQFNKCWFVFWYSGNFAAKWLCLQWGGGLEFDSPRFSRGGSDMLLFQSGSSMNSSSLTALEIVYKTKH